MDAQPNGRRRRWEALSQLYHAALGRDPSERAAFLADACAGDDVLRLEVESLLAHQGKLGDFLENPAFGLDVTTDAPDIRDGLIGCDLGAYRITSALGAGGMGEVYRARDTRLGRDVAIKLLPQAFTRDADRLARFDREARLLAALNHPNIGAIYGIEERVLSPESGRAEGGPVRALILELIEGETLADRISRGPAPVPDALAIARQIADALRGAHEKGIVHRDLKPSNIKVTREGRVKVLDFGLAKAIRPEIEESRSPTLTAGGTREGVVLGTAAYMSPEQARGLSVDRRTDIWAFGCVLYEMLAGRRAFAGETISDTLVAILEREPDWTALPSAVPARVGTVLRRCLQKDPTQRIGDVGQIQIALDELSTEVSGPVAAPVSDRRRGVRPLVFAGGAAALLLIAGLWQWGMSTAPAANSVRSLAILPLKPLQQNAEEDYLGLGIADTIITRIGQIEGLTVRPTSSVRRYGSAESDTLNAARELKVDAVLDGTVQRAADRLRVNMNLLRVSDGTSLWSRSFSTSFNDIFAVEDEIAQQVVAELRPRLTPLEQARLGKHYTSSPEAYEYYLKGIRTFGTVSFGGGTLTGDVETGLKMLERAIEIDPAYALAHAQMAWGYAWLGLFTNAGPVWIARAREALARANALDPDLAEAHVVRSLLLWSYFEGYQLVPAFEALKVAQRVNPNVGHFEIAALYAHVGMVDHALGAMQRAIDIDPTSAAYHTERVNMLWANARYDEAIAAAEKLSPRPRGWLVAYVGGGDVAEARRILDEARATSPYDPWLLVHHQARLLAREGKFREAEAALRPFTEAEQTNRNYHHATYSRACVYALGNKADRAVEWMRETVRHGMPNYPAFSRDTCFDPIRQTAVFSQFMSELKPTWEGYQRALR